ncbi:MAG: family 43 glycosylhydrolase [Planctomycetes bacterium]|nr:family 43 glycosylhydrolase [Planctomycetota bacterium]
METYTNPVGGDIHMGDPFVIQHEGKYYLYGTTARDGFKCWTSTDLVHWQGGGYAYQRKDDSWGKGSFWAPEVTKYRGKFYMVYSCTGPDPKKGFRLCIAVGDKPDGPFVDMHAPWCDNGWSCIDADLFIDDDGAPYLFFDKVGAVAGPVKYMYGIIYAMKLKEDLSGPAGEPVLCVQADQPWEEPDSKKSRCNEGAFVFRRGDTYYMTFSAGHYASPRYAIGYATAKSPLEPWTKGPGNPLAAANAEIGVSGPGHSNNVLSPDGREMFVVYHAHADPKKPGGDRTVNIDRLIFDKDGNLKMIGPTRSPQPMPSGAKSAK